MRFIDIADIKIKAGNGGNGKVSFHREKYVANGGPDGGDGGKGGDIIFQADDNLSTLADFRYKRKYKAADGENGKAGRSYGKNAKDLIINVPRGTLIKEKNSGRIIADISTDIPQVIAKGGKGGFGNAHFANAVRQVPRFAKPGIPGQELDIRLELKLLADVGLIGFPNVGKSTLISVVSQAKPQIANYHFTTITPNLGVVRLGEGSSFVIADIPGLIEGASEGLGLGHYFLRHIERCRLLVHIVDISGSEGRDPKEDFEKINKELEKFNIDLSKKPMIVAGNKYDLATDEQVEEFKKYIEDKGYKFFLMSAEISYGTTALIKYIQEVLSKLPPIKHYEAEKPTEEILSNNNRDIEVKVCDGIYIVEGEWLIRLIDSINFDDNESFAYFQKVLIDTGVIKKLKDNGIKDGDTVSIYEIEFEFFD